MDQRGTNIANHVNAWIEMDGNEAAQKIFAQLMQQIEAKRRQYDYGDVRPISSVLFGEAEAIHHDDKRLGGAKWVFVEDADDQQLSICSGWDPAFGVGAEIFKRLLAVDPKVSVWMTFEDENPNFVGASVWTLVDGNVVRNDSWEDTCDEEFVDQMELDDMDEDEAQECKTWDDKGEMISECLKAAREGLLTGEYQDFMIEYRGGY